MTNETSHPRPYFLRFSARIRPVDQWRICAATGGDRHTECKEQTPHLRNRRQQQATLMQSETRLMRCRLSNRGKVRQHAQAVTASEIPAPFAGDILFVVRRPCARMTHALVSSLRLDFMEQSY
jgi:hypothetical protein